jgi:hypothetical protein
MACWTMPTSTRCAVLRTPARRRLQGAGAHPAVRNLYGRAAGRGGPAAHPRGARSHAPATGHRLQGRLGMPPTKPPATPAPTRPMPVSPAAAPWPAWPSRTCAWPPRQRRHRVARQDAAALQGRRQHDRPLQRPGGPGFQRPSTGGQGPAALPRHVQGRSPGHRQVVRLQAGAPDRGGNVLPAVKQLMKHPDFSLRNPNRARSVIFSYCSATPAPSTAPMRPATCSGANA